MNTGATAARFRGGDAPAGPDPAALPAGAGKADTPPPGGRADSLSARQRFLLGRRLDINRAGWREIAGLPGISDEVARAVVATRERRGDFRRPEDLLAVRGIKEKRLKKILPFIAELPNN